MTALAWLGLALLAGSSRMPDVPFQTRLHVLVRPDPGAAVGNALISGIAADIRAIWKPYGVDVMFASAPGDLGADNDEVLRLVITDRLPPTSGGSRDGLGWIEFAAPGRPGRTLTVSAAAAWNLARQAIWAGVPIGELPASVRTRFLTHALGRAAAHEIGHYLLRSSSHARRGLMRHGFTIAEIMEESLAPYRLEPSQIAGLQQRLAEISSPRSKSEV